MGRQPKLIRHRCRSANKNTHMRKKKKKRNRESEQRHHPIFFLLFNKDIPASRVFGMKK